MKVHTETPRVRLLPRKVQVPLGKEFGILPLRDDVLANLVEDFGRGLVVDDDQVRVDAQLHVLVLADMQVAGALVYRVFQKVVQNRWLKFGRH